MSSTPTPSRITTIADARRHAHEKVPRGRFLPSKSDTLNLLEYEFQIFAILRLIMNLLILEKCN